MLHKKIQKGIFTFLAVAASIQSVSASAFDFRERPMNVRYGNFQTSGSTYRTMGALATLGRFNSRERVSAYVTIPFQGGYSHAGVLIGYRANPGQPDVAPAFLAVLHGGNGQCFVSLFDGLTNGTELKRVNVARCDGRIEIEARHGSVIASFDGTEMVRTRVNREIRGEYGIRGGTATNQAVTFVDVESR